MSREMLRGAPLLLLAFVAIVHSGASCAAERGLTLSRATEDESAMKQSPERYERLDLPIRGMSAVYFERTPQFDIPLAEIRAVRIRKERLPRNREEREEIIREELGLAPRKPPAPNAPPEAYYYNATFLLTMRGAQMLAGVTPSHPRGLFVLSIGPRPFAVADMPQPFSGDKLAVALYDKDMMRLRSVFSPLANKTTWE